MTSALDAVIRRFYGYRLLTSEGFIYPIITVHALAQGLDLAGVGFAAGMFFAGTLLGEIPTGYVGDLVGRRNSLAIGSVLVAATHFAFAFADSLFAFVLCWTFWGVSATFRSGSTDAWLYDTLVDHDATTRYTAVRGRSTATFYASAAAAALVGGVLYEYWPALPFLAAGVLTVFGGLLVSTLPEPQASATTDGFSPSEAYAALESVVSTRHLRAFVLLSAIVLAIPETVEIFVQPVALSVGFEPSLLGPLYAGLLVAAAVGSAMADPIADRLGIGLWFTLGTVALAGVLVLASAYPVVVVPAFFVSRGANTVTGTLGSTFLNDRIASEGRATALSGVSMIQALVFLLARSAGGSLAEVTTPLTALAAMGTVSVVAIALIRATADPFDSSRAVHPHAQSGERTS